MDDGLFRKVALDRLSSPEQLDQLMTVTTPRGWLVLLAMLVLLAAALGWGFLGSVATTVTGQGLLVSSGGVFNIAHHAEGQILDVEVAPGDFLTKGQSVALVAQPDLVLAIRQAKSELRVAASQTEYSAKLAQIQTLETKLSDYSRVVSPVSGAVLEIKVNPGEYIKPGQAIVSINLADVNTGQISREVAMYVPAEEGKRVVPGMEVRVSPSMVKKEEHGYILGKVRSVSELPVTTDGMLRVLGSRELVQKFLSGTTAVLELRVELLTDETTPSGYLWSSRRGPNLKIGDGTICSGSIVVKRQRPISLVLLEMDQLLRSVTDR